MKIKSIMFFCLLLYANIKNLFKKCTCISIKTKHSNDNHSIDNKKMKDPKYRQPTGLSFKYSQNKLGVIHEDIEYATINDNYEIKQYIFYS